MNVHWTETAERQLDSIHAYIAQDSEVYATRTINRITRKSEQIATFPLSGHKVPEFDMDQIREVSVSPYRIIYHLTPSQVEVLAVIHGAMNLLDEE